MALYIQNTCINKWLLKTITTTIPRVGPYLQKFSKKYKWYIIRTAVYVHCTKYFNTCINKWLLTTITTDSKIIKLSPVLNKA